MIVEIDHAFDQGRLTQGLGRSYYNPYFLLHAVTRQRLMPAEEWIAMFAESGWVVRSIDHPDPAVDPTRFEVGYLLAREGEEMA